MSAIGVIVGICAVLAAIFAIGCLYFELCASGLDRDETKVEHKSLNPTAVSNGGFLKDKKSNKFYILFIFLFGLIDILKVIEKIFL